MRLAETIDHKLTNDKSKFTCRANNLLCLYYSIVSLSSNNTCYYKGYFLLQPKITLSFHAWTLTFCVSLNSQFRIKVPVPVIMVTAYVVYWLCKAILPIRVSQSLMFTPAKMKYAILNRTFSCKRANDQLGYKPVVSLKVNNLILLAYVCIIISIYLRGDSHIYCIHIKM